MKTKSGYGGYLFVAYLMAFFSIPLFVKFGWVACLTIFGLSGLLFGTTFYLLGIIAKQIRMRSFLLQILVQSLLTAANVAVSGGSLGLAISAILTRRSLFDFGFYLSLLGYIQPGLAALVVAGGILASFCISGFFAVSKKLGPGVLWNWMTGKYYSPQEEELVVMFLDMKDSTTLAESLGTLKFSALVKDFFFDLTGPLQATGARVSHYIGDEAVIYWHPKAAFKQGACLELVTLFHGVLTNRSKHYLDRYGLVPEFKAGAHVGPVVATEVGELKSEVVFHGDTLNTAARIQGLCGEEGHGFLISGELASHVKGVGYALTFLGNRLVKGRAKEVELFAVRPL